MIRIKYILTLSLVLLCSMIANAQEDCFNGIDDDGDGLIDINDDDCNCSGLMPLNLFEDFETNICCPNFPSGPPGEGIDCLEDWVALAGSADYLNTCGYFGGPATPTAPLPFPSGDGCVGGLNQASNGEYVARCLDKPLITGESYDFSFHVGFNDNGTSWTSISPIEVVLYGSVDCVFPSFTGCISAQSSWVVLGSAIASGPMDSWTFVSSSFIADAPYQAIALGTTCQTEKTYTFFDDFSLDGLVQCPPLEINDQIQQFGDCVNGVSLSIAGEPGFDVQWYYQGVAIAGATNLIHNIEPGLEGEYTAMLHNAENCGIYEPIDVQIDENVLFVEGEVTNTSCFGENNGAIELDLFSSNLPINIEWDNGAFNSSIFDLEEGTYSVTITDANGCTGSNTFVVDGPEDPIQGELTSLVQPSDTNPFGQASVQASGGVPPYSFLWSNGQTNPAADSLSLGVNSVIITDANGCSDTLEVAIFLPLTYTVDLTNDACNLCEGRIDVEIAGGLPGYSIVWDNGLDTTSISDLCAAEYAFMIVDSFGTQLFDTIRIEGTAPLTPQIVSLEDTICNGSFSGSISLNTTGGAGNYSYIWSTGDTTSQLSNLSAGTYEVVVSDTNACFTLRTFNIVEQADIDIASTIIQPDCSSGTNGEIELTITGGQAPYNVMWSDGSTALSLLDSPSGIYEVTITDGLGCTQMDSFVLTNAGDLTASFTVEQATCFDAPVGNIFIENINPDSVTIFLNGQITGQEILGIDTGSYLIEIVDMMGCTVEESIVITSPDAIDANVLNISDLDLNGQSSATIAVSGGSPPYNIVWSNGETGLNPTMLPIGENIASITDANGCVTQLILPIEGPTLVMEHSLLHNECFGQCEGRAEIISIESLGALTYNWSNGEEGQMLSNLCNGNYDVTVTDNFGNVQVIEIEIVSPTALDIMVDTDHESCPGENDGVINVDINGGTSPYVITQDGQDFTGENLAPNVYELMIEDANGCQTPLEVEVLEFSVPPLETTVLDPSCGQFGEIGILNYEDYDDDILLLNDLSGSTTFSDNSIRDLLAGDYQIVLSVNDNCQVPLLDVSLEQSLQESIDTTIQYLEATGETVLLEVDEALLNEGTSIEWVLDQDYDCVEMDFNDNCTSIEVALAESKLVSALIIDEFGCEQVLQYRITVTSSFNVLAPNIISSNSNQRFKLVGNSDLIYLEDFAIYSRWGEKVYAEQDVLLNNMEGWDTNFSGNQVTQGVYVYTSQYRLPDGRMGTLAGDITVIR